MNAKTPSGNIDGFIDIQYTDVLNDVIHIVIAFFYTKGFQGLNTES